jgi:hypothetical protein
MRKVHWVVKCIICFFAIIGMLFTPIVLEAISQLYPESFLGKLLKLIFK